MALEYAGIVGCDPGPLTLRQLQAMAQSRLRHNWEQTSAQMALAANIALAGRSRPYSPDHFNPYRSDSPKDDVTVLSRDDAIAVFKTIAESAALR